MDTLKGFLSNRDKEEEDNSGGKSHNDVRNIENEQGIQNTPRENDQNRETHVTLSQPTLSRRERHTNSTLVRSSSTKEKTSNQKAPTRHLNTLDTIKLVRSQRGTDVANAIVINNGQSSEDDSTSPRKETSPKPATLESYPDSNTVATKKSDQPTQEIRETITETNNDSGLGLTGSLLGILNKVHRNKKANDSTEGETTRQRETDNSENDPATVSSRTDASSAISQGESEKSQGQEVQIMPGQSDNSKITNRQSLPLEHQLIESTQQVVPIVEVGDKNKSSSKLTDTEVAQTETARNSQQTPPAFHVTTQMSYTRTQNGMSNTSTSSTQPINDTSHYQQYLSVFGSNLSSQVPPNSSQSLKRPHDEMSNSQTLPNNKNGKIRKIDTTNSLDQGAAVNIATNPSAVSKNTNGSSITTQSNENKDSQSDEVLNTQHNSIPTTSSTQRPLKIHEMLTSNNNENNQAELVNTDNSSTFSSLDTQLAKDLVSRTKMPVATPSHVSDRSSNNINDSLQRDTSEIESSSSSDSLADSLEDGNSAKDKSEEARTAPGEVSAVGNSEETGKDDSDNDKEQSQPIVVKQEEPFFSSLRDSIVGNVASGIRGNSNANHNNITDENAQKPATLEVIYISDSDDEEGRDTPDDQSDEENSEDASSLSDVDGTDDNNDRALLSQNIEESNNLDIKGSADEMENQRKAYEHKLTKNATDILQSKKSQKKRDIIPLLESGIIKHTAFIKSKLVSSTNDITTCNNTDSAPTHYYQQLHKKDIIKEPIVQGVFSDEFLQRGSNLTPFGDSEDQPPNGNATGPSTENRENEESVSIQTQIIEDAAEDTTNNIPDNSVAIPLTDATSTQSNSGDSEENNESVDKDKSEENIEPGMNVGPDENNGPTEEDTSEEDSDSEDSDDSLENVAQVSNTLGKTNDTPITKSTPSEGIPETPEEIGKQVAVTSPKEVAEATTVSEESVNFADSDRSSVVDESDRLPNVGTNASHKETQHTPTEDNLPKLIENELEGNQTRAESGNAIVLPEEEIQERDNTASSNEDRNELRTATTISSNILIETETNSNRTSGSSKEIWRNEWLQNLKLFNFYPYEAFGSSNITNEDKRNINVSFDHITHILRTRYGVRILTNLNTRPNVILLKGNDSDFDRDKKLTSILNKFNADGNSKRIRVWSLSKVTKFLENMKSIHEDTNVQHPVTDIAQTSTVENDEDTREDIIIESEEEPDQTAPSEGEHNGEGHESNLSGTQNTDEHDNSVIQPSDYAEEVSGMITNLERLLSEAHIALEKEKSEHEQAGETIYELSNQILRQNMIAASLNARLELESSENSMLKEQLRLLQEKYSKRR